MGLDFNGGKQKTHQNEDYISNYAEVENWFADAKELSE